MPPRSPRSRRIAVVGALLFVTATCSNNSTSPTTTTNNSTSGLTNPTTASTDIQSVDTAFKSPVLASFSALAGSFIPASPKLAALVKATVPAMTAQKSSYGAAAARLLALRDGFASGAVRFTIIPTNVRGRIYRLKSATGPYVWDTTETGGPSNGVRFVLYKDSAFAVVTPLDSIGYVDLLDESSGSTNTLEVKITVGSTTYADYTISGSEGSSIDNLTLSGYVTDTKTMVNFTMTFNDNSTTGALTMNSTISAPAISFNYVFKLSVSSMTSGSTTTTTITLNYTVSDATDSLTAQGTLTEVESNSGTTESGTITVSANGVTFATITASASGETYSANTGSLSTSQQQALSSLFASGLELQVFVVFLIIPFGIV